MEVSGKMILTEKKTKALFISGLGDHAQIVRENMLINDWLKEKTKNTKKTYERIVREFFDFRPGISLRATTTNHISSFLFEHLEAMSRASQKLYRAALGSLFNFCLREGYLDKNPTLPIKAIKTDAMESMRLPSIEQIQQLFNSVENFRNLMILKMLYYTGLRVSELCSLEWKNFVPHVAGVKVTVVGKGMKVRSVIISKILFDELSKLHQDNSTYVFVSQKNLERSISVRQVESICEQASREAKLSLSINPHAFRHAHATHALKKGAALNLVQKNLGHSSIQTTSIYLHADMDDSSGLYL